MTNEFKISVTTALRRVRQFYHSRVELNARHEQIFTQPFRDSRIKVIFTGAVQHGCNVLSILKIDVNSII